ncbi:MAG: response regulator [Sulfuritalea sp.]|nr:response regulator [Sulfuritalea sp.]
MNPQKRVLIVEDNRDFARVLTRAFRKRSLEAVSVGDPEAALVEAKKSPPDYAIVDLRLGEASGMDLIGPLLAINPAARVLMLTGFAGIATAVDAIKLGACNYIAKPAYIEEIAVALGIDPGASADDPAQASGKRGFEELEWKRIQEILRDHDGNVTAAAHVLGMYRRTLQRKLEARSKAVGKDVLHEIRMQAPLRRRRDLRLAAGI